ncbi:RING-H2 finger protein ATL70-like [Quercus robur]|uniref:RING-H2 finger protein ATL70-like n=1 Tax=Quercus robur TaxID=38942 RepID=UPI0021612A31|nr:RING-H2 finger protein ATL70-like [Quercus robur]
MFSPPPHPLLSSPPPPSPAAHDHGHDHSLPKFEMELTFAALVLLAIFLCRKQCSNTNETQPRTQQHDIELGLPENTAQADHHVPSHHVPDLCAICLEDFEDGDVCRKLYACKHTFHKQCVDKWLTINTHCPLCRGSAKAAASANQN